jgi:hypothetical protein
MEPQRRIEVNVPEIKAPEVNVTVPDVHLPDFPNPMPTTVQQITIDKRLILALYIQLGLLNLGVLTGLVFFIWSLFQ